MFKYLSSLVFLFVAAQQASFAALPGYFSQEVIGLRKLVEVAKDSFESAYLDTLIKNEQFFEDAYNNNLVISSEINWNLANSGVMFMQLIDFLEKKIDADSVLILSKLNELYYLTFHKHLSHLDVPREKQVALIKALHYLYNFKDANGKEVLRSMLTRIFIYTIMVEIMGLHYYEKKEVLFLAYEEFRTALKDFALECANNAEALNQIEIFINDLAAYGMKEPIMKPSSVKRWLVGLVVISGIAIVGYKIASGFGFNWTTFTDSCQKTYDDVKSEVSKVTTSLAESVGRGIGQSLPDALAYERNDKGEYLMEPVLDKDGTQEIDEHRNPKTRKVPNKNMQAVTAAAGASMATSLINSLAYETNQLGEIIFEQRQGDNGLMQNHPRRSKHTQAMINAIGDTLGKSLTLSLAYETDDVGNIIHDQIQGNDGPQQTRPRQNKNMQAIANNLGANLGESLGKPLAASAVEGLLYEADNAPENQPLRRESRDTRKLVHGLGAGIVTGIADSIEANTTEYLSKILVKPRANRLVDSQNSEQWANELIQGRDNATRNEIARLNAPQEAVAVENSGNEDHDDLSHNAENNDSEDDVAYMADTEHQDNASHASTASQSAGGTEDDNLPGGIFGWGWAIGL
jgi:rhodanese-related sulfurtransferase